MTTPSTPQPGAILWCDLTIPNAERVRDFYTAVAGWRAEPVDMGGYSDFCMIPPGASEPVSGVCHARGVNADLPAQWLIYITVPDADAAAAEAKRQGGEIVVEPRNMGGGRMCVVRDPAGAVFALYTPGK